MIRDKYYAHLDKDYEKYVAEQTNTTFISITTCLSIIEKSIVTLTSKNELKSYLDKIPSRNHLVLNIK